MLLNRPTTPCKWRRERVDRSAAALVRPLAPAVLLILGSPFVRAPRTGSTPDRVGARLGSGPEAGPGALPKITGTHLKKKARKPCGLRAKFGGGRSPRALSRSHNIWRSRRLAGRVLPDATHRGMRWFRSHSGTVPALSDRNLSSEASTLGSVSTCRWIARRTGTGTPTRIVFAPAP